MRTPNNPKVMIKPDELGEMPVMKSSPPAKSMFESLLMDCCSFVGVALGVYDDIPPCASIAFIDSDDSDGSISDDSDIEAGASVFSRDVVKNETTKNANDTKTSITLNTISTLTMEKIPLAKRIIVSKANKDGSPSKFAQNAVLGQKLFDDAESLSTLQIPPSLDTKTVEIPPSTDTKALSKTLLGLKLVESKDKVSRPKDTERKLTNRSNSRQRNPYDIERVPSLVDTSEKDDESVVSAISTADIEPKESMKKRLFKGKAKILRAWSWKTNNKTQGNETIGAKSPSIWRDSFDAIPATNIKAPKVTNESARSSVAIGPVHSPIPSPVRRHAPMRAPLSPPRLPKKPRTETFRSTVPVIMITKSNDITASTVGTDEEETDNVPFDEEPSTKANSPFRHQTVQKLCVSRYLRSSSSSSSKVDIQEF